MQFPNSIDDGFDDDGGFDDDDGDGEDEEDEHTKIQSCEGVLAHAPNACHGSALPSCVNR